MLEYQPISSTRLGINAYRKAQGGAAAKAPMPQTARTMPNPVRKPRSEPAPAPSKRETKELKISVLRSLQAQSNSGLVRIRDVSSALDDVLKRP